MAKKLDVIDDLDLEITSTVAPKLDGRTAKAKQEEFRKKNATDVLPALLDEGTRVYQIAEMLKSGKSVHEIATFYGIPDASVIRLIRAAVARIYEDAAPIILNYVALSMMRTEHMIDTLWDKLLDGDGNPNDSVYARLQNLIDQQQRIIKTMSGGSSADSSAFKETLASHSKLYEEATKALNDKYQGGFIEREEGISDMDDVLDGGVIYSNGK